MYASYALNTESGCNSAMCKTSQSVKRTVLRQLQNFMLVCQLKTSETISFSVGKTSNFAVVPARLIVDKKDHGIQMFIVQLRDRQTHQPLPGKVKYSSKLLLNKIVTLEQSGHNFPLSYK